MSKTEAARLSITFVNAKFLSHPKNAGSLPVRSQEGGSIVTCQSRPNIDLNPTYTYIITLVGSRKIRSDTHCSLHDPGAVGTVGLRPGGAAESVFLDRDRPMRRRSIHNGTDVT